MASGSYDKTIKIWNLETGAQIKELKGHNGYNNSFVSVAFSPDGATLASICGTEIKIWDLESGAQIKELKDSYCIH